MKFSFFSFSVITLSLLINPSSGRIGNAEANNVDKFLEEEQKIFEYTQNDEEVHRVTKQKQKKKKSKHTMVVINGGQNIRTESVEGTGGSVGGVEMYYVCLSSSGIKDEIYTCSMDNKCNPEEACGVGETCTAPCFGEAPKVSGQKVCLGEDVEQCPTAMKGCESNDDCNSEASCYDPCGEGSIDKSSCNCPVY